MDPRLARRIAAIALISGVAGDALFDRTAPGINVPIAILAALLAATAFRPAGRQVDPLDLWIPPVTMLAALGVALRADPLVIVTDMGLAFVGAIAWAVAVSVGSLTRRSVGALLVLGTIAAGYVGFGAALVASAAARDGSVTGTGAASRRFVPVLRGLLIAVPILAIFMALLGSADIAFQRLVNDALAFSLDLDEVIRRSTIVALVAWLAAGGLAIAAAGLGGLGLPVPDGGAGLSDPTAASWTSASAGGRAKPSAAAAPAAEEAAPDAGAIPAAAAAPAAPASAPAAPATGWAAPGAGRAPAEDARTQPFETEALTVLLTVEVLFAVFVVIQVAYLFGGLATVASFGITYSQYAREGFFQLVAVVAGAGMLLVGVAAVAGRSRWFVPASVGLVVLTTVILVSAALRLGLYQQAYGWTELRLYVAAVIGWLAVCLGVALALVLARRIHWLLHGVALAAIAVVLAVTAIGPQAFITRQNVARALDPSLVPPEGKDGLDVAYVSGLGSGAIPVLVEALPRLDAATRAILLAELEIRRTQLESERPTKPWPAWNLERAQARDALRSLPTR